MPFKNLELGSRRALLSGRVHDTEVLLDASCANTCTCAKFFFFFERSVLTIRPQAGGLLNDRGS